MKGLDTRFYVKFMQLEIGLLTSDFLIYAILCVETPTKFIVRIYLYCLKNAINALKIS